MRFQTRSHRANVRTVRRHAAPDGAPRVRAGFTMPELLIAIILISIGLLSLAGGAVGVLRQMRVGQSIRDRRHRRHAAHGDHSQPGVQPDRNRRHGDHAWPAREVGDHRDQREGPSRRRVGDLHAAAGPHALRRNAVGGPMRMTPRLMNSRRPVTRSRTGFTMAETLVVLVLLAIVGGSLMNVLTKQQQFYNGTGELIVLRTQLRQAEAVLGGDLRGISSSGGDITTMTDSSIEFNYTIGTSVVCKAPAANTNTVIIPQTGALTNGNTLTSWIASRPSATRRTSSTKVLLRQTRPTTRGSCTA